MNWALIALILQGIAYIGAAIYTLWMRQIVKELDVVKKTLIDLVGKVGKVEGELSRMNGGHHGR